MDLSQFHGLGWATAVAVAVIVAAMAVFRRWRSQDEIRKLYVELKAKYEKAVEDGDLDLAASIAFRMRQLEKQF